MKSFLLSLLVASALVVAPVVHADVTIPVDPQYIQDVRLGQGNPPANASDEQLMVDGLSMCAYVVRKGGVIDGTTGLPIFSRSDLRSFLVQFEPNDGPIFDSAVKYLCPDAWSQVPA